mgnify:CR=1 FL=1
MQTPAPRTWAGERDLATKADLGTPLYSDTATGSYLVPTEFHREVIRALAGRPGLNTETLS